MTQAITETTFPVSTDVSLGGKLETVDYQKKLRVALRRPIEAIWKPTNDVVVCDAGNALISAIHLSFFSHYPLRLSPDVIWTTLSRGFAMHVNENAEALRHRFVEHEGQKELRVERLDFQPGADNPWPELFDAFALQINEQTGGLGSLVQSEFSTSGPVERAVSSLMAMETFKSYFEYVAMCGCGIPNITLTGTEDDWQLLREKARRFADYGLGHWIDALDPILEQFVTAKSGRADTDFWRSMFRYESGSGFSVMSGWLSVLYPYLVDYQDQAYPNPFLGDWEKRLREHDAQHWRDRVTDPNGPCPGHIPECFTSTPLKVIWGKTEQMMRLVGGLLCVTQQKDRTVEAEPGWVIVHEEPVDPLSEREQFLAGGAELN